MGKFYQCIQSYGPSFMTKFCSAHYLENLLTNIFAKLNLRGGVSCMPAPLLFLLLWGSFYEPHQEKTGLRHFQPGPTQTCLYSHRKELES